MSVRPVGDNIAIRFIDLDEDDLEERRRAWETPGAKTDDEKILAVVVGVGTDVTRKGFKKGDTVLLRPWAVNATELSDGVYVTDSYAVMAVVDDE